MQLGKTKLSYLITYGLAPFFRNVLEQELKACKFFSIGFDEALNDVVQRGQMDFIIRYYDMRRRETITHYYNSSFLGRASAKHLLSHFKEGLKNLDMNKRVHISMDGPNVNWKFIEI